MDYVFRENYFPQASVTYGYHILSYGTPPQMGDTRDMTFIKQRAWPRINLCIQEKTGSPANPSVFSAMNWMKGLIKEKWLNPCSHFMQSLFIIQFIVQQLLSDSLFLTVPYDPADISPHLTTSARLRTGPHHTIFVHSEQY